MNPGSRKGSSWTVALRLKTHQKRIKWVSPIVYRRPQKLMVGRSNIHCTRLHPHTPMLNNKIHTDRVIKLYRGTASIYTRGLSQG